MKKLIVLTTLLSGCTLTPAYERAGIAFSKESLAKANFETDYNECVGIAKSLQTNVANNTVGGAAAGAGIYAATAAILGADVGTLAGLGALHGGVMGAGGSAAYNSHNYKSSFVQCMRDRDYQVYF